ncbi:MAG: MarR family transcriptional regulator [Gemmatimonas sp.]|jgi:MarR family 2-MHQ and catechol resistance regulon transcriptional repressor|uniref:MarR family winged helix-turn-helix transcriptional regulator n=1 Tax=Gemmatimonas sp. TaxID=1962908 RepID=UPI0031BD1AFA|nr:MarR family transcriptional regulator [Gemmatimonas sp.]
MSKGEKKRRRALDAYWSLQRAAALAAARVDDAVQPFSLSASQYGVLDTLQHRGPVHQQELAEALGRSKAQMTAIIDALEARALVRRERHEVDRRYITVYLTEAGRVLLAEAGPARTDSILELMRELSGEQKTKLMRLCGRLLRVLDPLADADETPDERASPSVAAADDASDDDDDDDHVDTETPIETSPN